MCIAIYIIMYTIIARTAFFQYNIIPSYYSASTDLIKFILIVIGWSLTICTHTLNNILYRCSLHVLCNASIVIENVTKYNIGIWFKNISAYNDYMNLFWWNIWYNTFGLMKIYQEESVFNASTTLKYNHNIKNKNNGEFQLGMTKCIIYLYIFFSVYRPSWLGGKFKNVSFYMLHLYTYLIFLTL